MSLASFEEFDVSVLNTAAFLHDESPAKVIRDGLAEEYVELMTPDKHGDQFERALWGLPVEPDVHDRLRHHTLSETGDNLYYLAAANHLRGCSSIPMLQRAGEVLGGESTVTNDFGKLDELAGSHSLGQMPEGATPDYLALQFFNVPPFLPDPRDGRYFSPDADPLNPVRFTPDGKFVLASTIGWALETVDGGSEIQEDYIAVAGLAVAAIAVVARDRFDVTLADIVDHNAKKRERRNQAGTIRDGDNPERSRAAGEGRPVFSNYEARLISYLA